MFTFTSDSPHYSEVQRVLREEIVNPLRRHGYVRADRVMKLRTLLERLSDVPGLTSEEKLSSGQESYCYQLFVEKDERVTLPTVQQLLEQSFATSGVKLSEVPAAFIIQMPRFGKNYKVYQRVLPSPLLDVTDLIEGLSRMRRRRRARVGRAVCSCPVPRVYMELFAVLCIETSHYVAFVKTGVAHDAP
ncbi:unnamed protein product [Leptidea sinapis]|uniref:Uncharacterized protein n=1 Tax=Leptidea sinapis TaxID=189913 RepID=A0A5E4Q4K8_9NEOP|nr:unnamed protein product [Leptidea sinapis]